MVWYGMVWCCKVGVVCHCVMCYCIYSMARCGMMWRCMVCVCFGVVWYGVDNVVWSGLVL